MNQIKKVKTLFKLNLLVASASLVGIYFLDYPFELIPMIGIAWSLISSLESLRVLLRRR